ncbi:MAG: hypothetical protein R2778_00595 [Saprospiraceae bacterium]
MCWRDCREVDGEMVQQRVTDGYIKPENVYQDLDKLIADMEEAREQKKAITLVYHGNIVDLWERFVQDNIKVGYV